MVDIGDKEYRLKLVEPIKFLAKKEALIHFVDLHY